MTDPADAPDLSDRLADLLIYAPLGLLWERDQVLERLVKRGRSQTQLAKLAAQMAAQRGPEEVEKQVNARGGEVHLRQKVVGLQRSGKRVTAAEVMDLATGEVRVIDCDAFISTMPLLTASKPSAAGMSSPAPKNWMRRRLFDIFWMRSTRSRAVPGPVE